MDRHAEKQVISFEPFDIGQKKSDQPTGANVDTPKTSSRHHFRRLQTLLAISLEGIEISKIWKAADQLWPLPCWAKKLV